MFSYSSKAVVLYHYVPAEQVSYSSKAVVLYHYESIWSFHWTASLLYCVLPAATLDYDTLLYAAQ